MNDKIDDQANSTGPKPSIQRTAIGGHAGTQNVQVNSIVVYNALVKNGEVFNTFASYMNDDAIRSLYVMIHELGHTAGCDHVFSEISGLQDRWTTGELDNNFMSYDLMRQKSDVWELGAGGITPNFLDQMIPEQLDMINSNFEEQEADTNPNDDH